MWPFKKTKEFSFDDYSRDHAGRRSFKKGIHIWETHTIDEYRIWLNVNGKISSKNIRKECWDQKIRLDQVKKLIDEIFDEIFNSKPLEIGDIVKFDVPPKFKIENKDA